MGNPVPQAWDDSNRVMGWHTHQLNRAFSAYECARKLNIDTPIIDQIYSVLYEEKRPDQAMQELLGRDQKAERV